MTNQTRTVALTNIPAEVMNYKKYLAGLGCKITAETTDADGRLVHLTFTK